MGQADTFHLKKSQKVVRGIAPWFFILMGLMLCGLSIPIFSSSDDQLVAGICVIGIAILSFGMAALGFKGNAGGPQFVTISDDGINISNRAVFLWDEVESVREQDVVMRSRGITIRKKQLLFRYAEQTSQEIKTTTILSDFEGYDFIREKVRRFTQDRFTVEG